MLGGGPGRDAGTKKGTPWIWSQWVCPMNRWIRSGWRPVRARWSPSSRAPVPQSSTISVPSAARTSMHDVLPPYRAVLDPGAAMDPRGPQKRTFTAPPPIPNAAPGPPAPWGGPPPPAGTQPGPDGRRPGRPWLRPRDPIRMRRGPQAEEETVRHDAATHPHGRCRLPREARPGGRRGQGGGAGGGWARRARRAPPARGPKAACPGPLPFGSRIPPGTTYRGLVDVAERFAEVINAELRGLVAAGARLIQIDEPARGNVSGGEMARLLNIAAAGGG